MRALASASVLALLCVGCEGEPNGGAPTSTAGSPAAGGSMNIAGGGAGGSSAVEPQGRTLLRRLNRVELANTLTALTGSEASPDDLLPPDPEVQGFDTIATAIETTPGVVEQLMQVAATTAAVLPGEDIATLARRVLRRPATAAELASYTALFDGVQAREGEAVAFAAVAERLLASPDFLYRLELGIDASGRLAEHELAARLAYTFWEAPPDSELSSLADQGLLGAQLGPQVERLLQDERAKQVFRRFLSGWLETGDIDHVTKDPVAYPGFDALKPELMAELSGFVSALVDDDAPIRAIVSAPFTVAGPGLAAFYGISHPGGGAVRLDISDRPGLLTRAGFLSTFGRARGSSPIRRGAFIRQRLLCLPLGVPPPGADALSPEAVATTTTRELFTTLTAPANCAGCHGLINPLGFALENYDGVGQFRAAENGVSVDPSGLVLLGGEEPQQVSGAAELSAALAQDPQLVRCVATQWFRSRFGRIETGGDRAIVGAVAEALGSGEHLLDAARALGQVPELGYAHFRREVAP